MDSIFKSKEYAWVDVTIVMLGKPVGGARAVEYKTKAQMEVLYAAGRKGRSIQRGKKEVEGTLTVLQSEIIAMNASARAKGYNDITDVEFDLIVAYAPVGAIVTTDKIVNVSFTEISHSIKEGDLYQEHALPFLALDIEYNVL